MSHLPRAGFSLGFASRPAFAIASRAGIWAEKSQQAEIWTANPPTSHVFDPAVFDAYPIFDTNTAGVWTEKSRQSEVWTQA